MKARAGHSALTPFLWRTVWCCCLVHWFMRMIPWVQSKNGHSEFGLLLELVVVDTFKI